LASVQVWRSQLTANDFPPVCAMTGAPAETWRKFTFTSTPPWAFLLGALGAAAFSSRVTGYLPLTRTSSKRVTIARSVFFGFIPLAILFWVASAMVLPEPNGDATRGAIAGFLFLFGLAAFGIAIIGILVGRNSFGPSGKIIERREYNQPIVELGRVHPVFVGAVQQHQQARAAQVQAAQPPPPPRPPESPFPPGKYSY